MKDLCYVWGLNIVLGLIAGVVALAFFYRDSDSHRIKSNPSVIYLLKGGHAFTIDYESHEKAAEDYEKVKKAWSDSFAGRSTGYAEYISDSQKTKTMIPLTEISALRLRE